MRERSDTKKFTTDTDSSIDLISLMILVGLSIIWGSSFMLIKKSLIAFNPLQVACFRISIAGIAFLPFIINEFRKVNKKDIKYLLIVSIGGSGVPAFLYALGQTQVSSSVAGLLNSLTPLFTLILGVILFKTQITFLKVSGVILGMIGAGLLIAFGKDTGVGSDLFYPMLIVIATIGYAVSVNTISTYLGHLKPITISSIAFGLITLPALLILMSTQVIEVFRTDDHAIPSFIYVSLLSFLGTFLANIYFYKLVQRTNALFASTVSYVIPIVALAWGYFDNEIIGIYHIIGFLLILSGVYLTRGKKQNNVSKK